MGWYIALGCVVAYVLVILAHDIVSKLLDRRREEQRREDLRREEQRNDEKRRREDERTRMLERQSHLKP